MTAYNGVTTETMNRLAIGPGALYKNFVNPATPGTIISATSGGNIFRIERELYTPEIDGLKGPLKGSSRVVKEVAYIDTNLVEITKENLMLAIAGLTQTDFGSPATHTKLTSSGEISAGDHIDTIAIVGKLSGTTNPICVVIKNALSTDPEELALGDGKNTVVLKTKFTSYYDPSSPGVPPWEIYMPKS